MRSATACLFLCGPELRLYLPFSVHSALMAAWVVALVVALESSFRHAIAGSDSNATPVLALMASRVTAALAHRIQSEQIATSVADDAGRERT
jgi:hypothetical protein